MDSTTSGCSQTHIQYRAGQLEAELRLVKEQLSQANAANQYLLSKLSAPSADHYDEGRGRLKKQYEHAVRQNVRLKAQFGLTPRITSNFRIGTRPITHRRKDSVASVSETVPEDTEVDQIDLLSFDVDEESALVSTLHPLESVNVSEPTGQGMNESGTGLGIANSFPPTSPCPDTDAQNDVFNACSRAVSTQKQSGFEIKYGDGTTCFIPTSATTLDSSLPLDASFSRPVAPQPFHDREHMRMMGMACFLEDESPEERARVWHKYALSNTRHSGYEYRRYYDEVVRPAYLEKMKAREQKHKHDVKEDVNEHEMLEAALEHEGEINVNTNEDASAMHFEEMRTSALLWEYGIQAGNSTPPSMVSSQLTDSAQAEGLSVTPQSTPHATNAMIEAVIPQSSLPTIPSGTFPQSPSDSTSSLPTVPLGDQSDAPSPCPPRNRIFDQRPRSMEQTGPLEVRELFAPTLSNDPHAYRTVTISNIPKQASLSDILSSIHSSQILSATLHETAGFRTIPPINTNTATIVFVSGCDVKSFMQACEKSFMLTLTSNPGTSFPAHIDLLPTVTRPLLPWVINQLKDQSLSRVLFIHDFNQLWTLDQVVEELMRNGAKKPLKQDFDHKVPGLMLLEFASIYEAKEAWHAVHGAWRFFQGVQKGYAGDPCAKSRGLLIAETVSAAEGEGVEQIVQVETDLEGAGSED